MNSKGGGRVVFSYLGVYSDWRSEGEVWGYMNLYSALKFGVNMT